MVQTSITQTILLVEDEALIAMNETALLEQEGYTVVAAGNGAEAIEIVKNNEIDLILMDIDLGDDSLDGTEAARIILGQQDIPIVFLSSHTESEMVEKTEAITNYGYIIKNIGDPVLLASVKMAFRLHSAHQELRKKDRLLSAASPIGYYEINLASGTAFWSDETFRIFGLDPRTDTSPTVAEYEKMIHPDDRERLYADYFRCINEGTRFDLEYRIIRKNGEIRLVHSMADVDSYHGTMFGIFHDITKQHNVAEELQASRERFKQILEKMPIPIAIVEGPDEKVLTVNNKFIEVIGYTTEEVPDMAHWWPLAYPDKEYRDQITRKRMEQKSASSRNSGELEPFTATITCKDGTSRFMSLRTYSFKGTTIVAFMDLSEIHRTQLELEEALREKGFLLKELNHRVKNNLTMISSLVKLKDADLGDTADLSDIESQIDAIQIVYEKLQQAEGYTQLNIEEYLVSLLENVFSLAGHQVTIEKKINLKTLSTRLSIPMGLVVNELATNAIKYGFTKGEKDWFSLELTTNNKNHNCTLRISNSGPPFPEEINLDNPGTLGLRLVLALTQQLNGTIELKRQPHPVFTIQFPTK